MAKQLALIALTAAALAACEPGNAVAVFTRSADGMLTQAGSFATGGTGTGAGLGIAPLRSPRPH